MANFSTKERLIASFLSATPGLKRLVKQIYITINAVIYHKDYNAKILDSRVNEIVSFYSDSESFGGYYDKTSINNKGMVLVNIPTQSTAVKPNPRFPVGIRVVDLRTRQKVNLIDSETYTWQQGVRSQWIDDDVVVFNVLKDNKYKALAYSLDERIVVKEFEFPVQDAYLKDYFLSINYSRIMALRPDYGYRSLAIPSRTELECLDNDGIWYVSYNDGESKLLYTLQEIISVEPKDTFDVSLHKVNHLMIKPDGKGFIFIHRWYRGKRRFDRLMYSDFKRMKVLADDEIVSHMCWVDDNTVFGYLRFEGKDGFYFIDINTGKFTLCDKMTELATGDGHPTVYGEWIAFDTYPDKSRMQHLYLYHIKTCELFPLLELYHGLKYTGECRCDLHPRFSKDGRYVFFDTVYLGKRTLCYIDISRIVV